jgi:hypothetical protein
VPASYGVGSMKSVIRASSVQRLVGTQTKVEWQQQLMTLNLLARHSHHLADHAIAFAKNVQGSSRVHGQMNVRAAA